ncbi:uncharacterized protein LOC123504824 isoform X2 [Portunus trituberculatus]|uniref:uncharacterized protein LOC123504824 isoform X2 n=1 Tax=Portunus trituberculatus TaxID=210409 RepID=UPI001E1D0357|nr:uncharacterized protein LOC123504824 isoform X2 [Portunus trituberculatus]
MGMTNTRTDGCTPKEEEKGGDNIQPGEGEGEGGIHESTEKLEQQPGKLTTTTTLENVSVRTHEITEPEGTTPEFEERGTREGGGGEKPNTDDSGRKEGDLPREREEGKEEEEKGRVEAEEKEINSREASSAQTGQQETVYWGVTRGGELPPSVSACFEVSPSLLARVQERLLSLPGRANRYCLPRSLPTTPIMPLEVLRRKVKEARHKLLHHSHSSSKGSHKDSKSSASDCSSVSDSSVPVTSTPIVSIRGTGGYREVEEPLQKYWGGEERSGTVEEEIELLQHLAKSRKRSAQLRRIRDSLLLQVRSRPNSVVTPLDPAHPAQTPKNDMQQLRDFLLDIGFVQDYSILNRHGYDLATAAHMDALDLAGAGVTEPLHRMALKHELNLMQRPPQVPEEVPETVEQWLEGLALTDYVDNFHLNGIYCPLAAINLTKRDLQLMGVYMQGHRKKILLSLAALKESLFRQQ